MYRGLIIRIIIHSFYDVNFSSNRPIRSVGPESTALNINFDDNLFKFKNSRPSATPSRHVNGIHDDQPTIILILGRNTYAIPCIRYLQRSFDPHDSISIIINFKEATGLLSSVV